MRLARRVTLLLVALLAAALLADSAVAGKTIDWVPCYEDVGPFECGTLQVPLDYDKKRPFVQLSLVRLPASDPAERIGSLFVNPGGPGGSGIEFVVFGNFLFTDEVKAKFDLVGFDPRGIGASTQLRCFASEEEWGPYFTPFAFPLTPEEETLWIASDRYLNKACMHKGDRIQDHMSTANAARDLDRMREAVGDAMLTYAGYSYGSYLGNTYANLFPGKVRALAIDGVLDPVAWSTGRGNEAATLPFSTRLRSDVGAQATLDQFFSLCDAGGPSCAFAGDAAERYAAMAESLLADPLELTLPDGSTGVFTYQDLVGESLSAMYFSPAWPGFAQFLADLEAALGGATAQFSTTMRFRQTAPYTPRPEGMPPYFNFLEGFPGVACADSDNPDSYAAWSAAGAAADAAHGYFGRLWTWVSSICAEWPGADADRYMGPFNRQTANPVLVVGNLFDPATPYHGAQIAHALLPGSALLTVHAWGHTSLGVSQCADQVLTRYLVDLDVPAPGTVCEQDFVPFD